MGSSWNKTQENWCMHLKNFVFLTISRALIISLSPVKSFSTITCISENVNSHDEKAIYAITEYFLRDSVYMQLFSLNNITLSRPKLIPSVLTVH